MTDDGPKALPPGVTKLGPNRWQLRVQGRDRRTGKKNGRSETFQGTRREALLRHGELRSELRSEGSRPKRQQLRAYAIAWLSSRHDGLKPSVRRKYENNLGLHILPALGDLYLDSIRPTDVRQFLDRKLAEGYAPNTVLNMLRLIRTIAHDAQVDGACPIYFADRVRPPAVEGYTEENPNLLTADQLRLLLDAIPAQWRALVVLIALTGLRWGEASALMWEDIDWKAADLENGVAGVLRIQRGNDHGSAVFVKTMKSKRVVPLPDVVAALLGDPRRRRGWLFPTAKGTLHRGSPLRKVLDRAFVKAGVPRVTPHGLRRTFNNLGRQSADRQVVKAVMGHASDSMHTHYSMVGRDEKALLQSKVRALLVEKPKKKGEDET